MPNRHALVTGASGGIGRQIVAALIRADIAVAALDIADSVVELDALGRPGVPVHPIRVDVRDADQCVAAAAEAGRQLGDLDVLVNNAGVMHKKPLAEHDVDDWDLEMAVNARAPFLFCRELMPPMAARGTGVVINVASIWGSRGGPERAAYIAAKHAVIGLTKALAAEYGARGVRVNAVSPGPVRTPMTAPLGGDQSAWMNPAEVAEVVAFLCSPAAAAINGVNLEVPGQGRPAGL